MSNSFTKDQRTAFDELLAGFEDQLVLSNAVRIYNTDQTEMVRSDDIITRPKPYIARSFNGTDQTANFQNFTQLTVPATIGYEQSAPWTMSARDLSDTQQEGRLMEAARQRLASDINITIMNIASRQGTLVVPRSGAASGYDDIAECDALMNEQGIPYANRCIALSSRDYNGMASNLAARQTMNGKPNTAYEKSYVGMVAGFETLKMDYAIRLPAAQGGAGLTISTLDGAGNHYTPRAMSISQFSGEKSKVDNRYQTVTISSTANVVSGDCFTIAGINAVHHITKGDTGQLKTFRVVSVNSATTMTISPPIVSNQVDNSASAQYQNCVVNTKAANSAITFLNIVAAPINPFFHKDALELLPARYDKEIGSGLDVMRATTSQGFEIVMMKETSINNMETKFRMDVLYGAVCLDPEMVGIEIFNQT